MSGLRSKVDYFTGAVTGFREVLRAPRQQDPRGLLRASLERRQENFLELARRVIFANPANPFHQMFRMAGCSFEDLSAGVRREGIESTLAALHRNGVYLSHDEFKRKTPIVRSSRTIPTDESSFRNPLSKGTLVGLSGGSRSGGTKVYASTAARVYREAYDTLMIDEFDLTRRRHVMLKPILPAVDGIANLARAGRLGCTLDRWFSPVARTADSVHYRMATYSMVALARLYGVRLPFPSDLPPNDFGPVARWLARRGEQGMASVVISYASPAARVASAATELGLSLASTLFLTGGETLTDAKRHAIEASGARVFARYSISEFGAIGHACRRMTSGDGVHVFTDSVALISHRRPAPFSGVPLDSLLFTSLQLHAPHVFINVEMDDAGSIERSMSCDCEYGALGFTTVLRDINSFGKLTGHGVTLVGTDILRILEHALPSRFGGTATDYQLVERDAANQAQLTLRVSRRVRPASLAHVKDGFLEELRECYGGQIASRLWRDANALEVVHEDPIATGRGKILPLHLLRSGERRAGG